MKQIYRVVFDNNYSTHPTKITKIVVTSDIEKSIGRLRKQYEKQLPPLFSKASNYITLSSVELIGKATLHA